ncbi:MAG: ribosomal protein S18-alanine N-acetyltransferase, partial [Candidatus Acidiferrales bacterium]
MSAVAIRFLESRDIPEILRIQSSSREAAQWSQSAYENLEGPGQQAWVAEHEGYLVGFLAARVMASEIEILNLAVDPSVRREGIGCALLREALSWAVQSGAGRAFLEVRVSNAPARQFYEAHGFASAGVRANYYRDPIEA